MRSFIILINLLILSHQMHLWHHATEHMKKKLHQHQGKHESGSSFDYPVRFAYVNRINQWWPPENIAGGIGVPGYADQTIYNFIALTFWTYSNGPSDTSLIWADPIKYLGDSSVFGSTKDQIQKNLKKKYNDGGVKILISAFGAT